MSRYTKIPRTDSLTKQRHMAVIAEFKRQTEAMWKPYEEAAPNQRPSINSLLDIIYATLARKHFYSKRQIERIVGGQYSYEETNDNPDS